MTRPYRTGVWRGLGDPSMELFTLRKLPGGWQLAGTVVAVAGGQPLRASYVIACTASWQTRHVELLVVDASGERRLALDTTGNGQWQLNGHALDTVAGCVDVDLGITPATNTLPIRRLQLAVGEHADVVATWVRFPALTIEPLSQLYTRTGDNRYRYESDTGFTCDLDVDDDGIVTHYPGGWDLIA